MCIVPDPITLLDHIFTFADKTITLTSNQLTIEKGAEEFTPKPMLIRGLYFDGDDKLTIPGLILNNAFTL